MFKRLFSELARVFVPAGRNPDFSALIDFPCCALDAAAIEKENGLSRLRDSAGMRAARSRRRVWRLREVRRDLRREMHPAPRL